jgi:hypothetical protein
MAWQPEGLHRLSSISTPADHTSEGYKGAASNGFGNGVAGTQVTVNWPPVSGLYADRADKLGFVEAIITQPRPTTFMAILGFQKATVSARAVAGVADSHNCVYALDRTKKQALNLNGGATVNAACGVVVDSNNADALDDSGGACMTATSMSVTGGVGGSTNCLKTPTLMTSVPPEPDPLAGRAAPSFSSTTCDYGTGTTSFCSPSRTLSSGTWTLQPGVYCDGICINGTAQVTFAPGVYVLNGGGLKITGGTVNGTGVTFFNTATSGHTPGSVDISGGPTGALSAPTSGAMGAILFFGDRTVSWSGSSANNTINGGGTLTLEGTLYFPTTNLTFAGNNSPTGTYTILIADTIKFTGTSTLNNDFGSLADGSPIKTVALAE